MAIDDQIARLLDAGVDHVGPSVAEEVLSAALPPGLPEDYLKVLRRLNGLSVQSGVNRLFGVRGEPTMDLRAWNETDNWKFAWAGRVDQFLCIGETAFGDQYAFRYEGGVLSSEVYLLEANFLEPEVSGGTFEEFFVTEFVRNAEDPWDLVAVEAVKKFGSIDISKNWVYSPSVALGGPDDISNVMQMDSFAAMTIAGDIVTAIYSAPAEAILKGVSPWLDERGRPRLSVNFESS